MGLAVLGIFSPHRGKAVGLMPPPWKQSHLFERFLCTQQCAKRAVAGDLFEIYRQFQVLSFPF